MAVDPVPWVMGGGAQIDPYVARQATNIFTRNSQGVQLPGHLKVTQQGTAAGSVLVAAGGVTIRSLQAPGQSYVGRVASPHTVPVAPNNTGSPRSDLIIARIIDPDYTPWQPYSDPNQILFGPYFELFVVSGVPSTTVRASQVAAVNYSAVELALVTLPPGTTNITDGMLKDLRSLSQPRIGFANALQVGPNPDDYLTTSDTSYGIFPNNSLGLVVPDWATNALCAIDLNGIFTNGNPSNADFKVNFGGILSDEVSVWNYNGQPGSFSGAGYWEIVPHFVMANIDCRALQGQSVVVRPEAKRTFTGNNGSMMVGAKQQVRFNITFLERIV